MTWAAVASVGVGLLTSDGGGEQQQSTKREMDPRMVPYIFGGDGSRGLFDYGSDQLARSQSPERMAGWQQMMNRGQGLMGGTVAGNPFSGGYKGGGNFGSLNMGNGLGAYQPPPMQPPQQPVQQPQQQPQFNIDDIYAEIVRRQQAEANDRYMAQGGSGGGGM